MKLFSLYYLWPHLLRCSGEKLQKSNRIQKVYPYLDQKVNNEFKEMQNGQLKWRLFHKILINTKFLENLLRTERLETMVRGTDVSRKTGTRKHGYEERRGHPEKTFSIVNKNKASSQLSG